MTVKDEFDFLVDQLLDNAVKEFKTTEQYMLLQEKLDRMETDCETILNPGDRGFVTECFELILEVNGQEEIYVYRKGLTDSVKILKWLGVLA